MRSSILALLILISAPWSPVHAQGSEPQIYLFYSESCPYSQAVRSLLRSIQGRDKTLRVREFEVEGSDENLELLGKVYEEVGMPDLWVVPLLVIGPYVIVGYADEPTTTAEILDAVEECRKKGCPDALRELIDRQKGLKEASGGQNDNILKCSSPTSGRLDRSAPILQMQQP